MYNTPWQRPYEGLSKLPKEEVRRLTIELPASDATTIMSVALNNNIFSLICQTALKTTAEYVRTNSLTYADSQRLIDFVRSSADRGVASQANAYPLRGGTTSVHTGVANAGNVSSGTRKEVKGRERK